MTYSQFQGVYSAQWKQFLATDTGKALLETLHGMRPPLNHKQIPHQVIQEYGVIQGYEMCQKNMIFLCDIITSKPQIEANYGVTKEKTE